MSVKLEHPHVQKTSSVQTMKDLLSAQVNDVKVIKE